MAREPYGLREPLLLLQRELRRYGDHIGHDAPDDDQERQHAESHEMEVLVAGAGGMRRQLGVKPALQHELQVPGQRQQDGEDDVGFLFLRILGAVDGNDAVIREQPASDNGDGGDALVNGVV